MLLVVMIHGTFSFKRWAWWFSCIYFFLFTVSTISTLLPSSFSGIITLLNFPVTETAALINVPLSGIHLSMIVGIPQIATLIAILRSKKFFTGPEKA